MAFTPEQLIEIRKRAGIPEGGFGSQVESPAAKVARMRLQAAEYDAAQAAKAPKKSFFQETKEDIMQTGRNLKETFTGTVDKVKEAEEARLRGEQGFARTRLQTVGAMAGGVSKGIGDVVTGVAKTVLPEKKEEIIRSTVKSTLEAVAPVAVKIDETLGSPVGTFINKYSQLDDKTKRDVDALLGIGSLALDVATGGTGKKVAQKGIQMGTDVVENVAKTAARTADMITESAAKVVPSEAFQGIKQTGTEVLERFPRALTRLKEGAKEASERATQIASSEPVVANALKSNLDNRIINTIAEADKPTLKAFKDVVDIAEESPSKIGMARQPSVVSGELATKQFNIINKQKKSVGQQIGEKVKQLSKTVSANIDDSFREMGNILQNQGINVQRTKKGLNLDFKGTSFTPGERTKIEELFRLATEGGDNLSPAKIHAKDQLFSKLQREARMEGVGDIMVETPDGVRSLFGVFRDIYSKKLDEIAPDIRDLNRQYRQFSQIVEDIEDSIFKTPNFNATKSVDPAEFAKVNLRRIFGESQSSPAFEAVADKMDALARQLGYEDASPKMIAEFAQELRKLYPETIPKTGFQGGIKMGLGDIVEKALNVGAPNTADQRKALISLIEEFLLK